MAITKLIGMEKPVKEVNGTIFPNAYKLFGPNAAQTLKLSTKIKAGQVKIHRGYSTDILEQFPDEYFDWIYIDGNHLYEYVKNDLYHVRIISDKKIFVCSWALARTIR